MFHLLLKAVLRAILSVKSPLYFLHIPTICLNMTEDKQGTRLVAHWKVPTVPGDWLVSTHSRPKPSFDSMSTFETSGMRFVKRREKSLFGQTDRVSLELSFKPGKSIGSRCVSERKGGVSAGSPIPSLHIYVQISYLYLKAKSDISF
jgi:hypothetical protein